MSKVINIEDFFTESNEKNGMWHEPVFDGVPCGLEFLIIGIHSREAMERMEYYDNLLEQLDPSMPEEERDLKEREIDAERVASLTKDMRATNGEDIMIDGKKVVFDKEFIKRLYMEAPLFKMDNIEFALKSSNYMNKKVSGE